LDIIYSEIIIVPVFIQAVIAGKSKMLIRFMIP